MPPALASFVRRDVLARPVLWVHAADDAASAPPGASGWPLTPESHDLHPLGLTPCVLLPSALPWVPDPPAHAVIVRHDPTPDEMRPLEEQARQRLAERLIAGISLPPPSLRFTVIIPTYERPAQAMEAARAVLEQDFPTDAYELVIIDNSRHPDPMANVHAALSAERRPTDPSSRLIYVPVAGVSLARNTGIAAARGEIICSIDDDCLPQRDWLTALNEAWRTMPEAGIIGGEMLLQLPDPIPKTFQSDWEPIWSHLSVGGTQFVRCHDWRSYPWGGNWSARRDVLWQAGGFPVRYGIRGAAHESGEEIAMAAAAALAGRAVMLCPTAKVIHRPAPDRYTMAHVKRTLTASALLEHHLYKDGLIPSATSPLGTLSQMLRALATMLAAGLMGRRHLARDRRLRAGALGHKLLVQFGLHSDGNQTRRTSR